MRHHTSLPFVRNLIRGTLVIASVCFAPLSADAQVLYTWNNTGNDWTQAASWNPGGGPPGALDTAQINALGTTILSVNNHPTLAVPQTVLQASFGNNAIGGGWVLSGAGSLTAGSATVSGMVTRGTGTYVIDLGSGSVNSLVLTGSATAQTYNGAMSIGTGSTLYLNGNTVATTTGNISFQGGRLLLDNSAGNPGLQRLSGAGQIYMNGGGATLEFRSASGGTTFNGLTGALSVGSGDSIIRAVQPVGATSSLNVLFGSIARTNTQGTINFVNGGSGTLGGGGATDPAIRFTAAVTLANNVIANSATTPGYAIYNGTDFAGYSVANGVIPVASTIVNGPLTTAATQNSNLDNNASIAAATTVAYNTLKISPSAGGQSLTLANPTTSILNTVGVLLQGTNDYSITGGAITGGATRYLYVTNAGTTLSTDSNLGSINQPINKAGDGFLALTGTTNQVPFTTAQNVNLTGGTLRVTGTNFDLTPATAPILRFRGGVIEYDVSGGSFTFNRPIGVAAGSVNWANTGANQTAGSGGFSAFSSTPGNALTVNLGGAAAPVTWGDGANFVQDGSALRFGSTKSNATVIFQNPINLDSGALNLPYAIRTINVTPGTGSATDFTEIASVISGTANTDLRKTSLGTLKLTAANTYLGRTIIAGGTVSADNGSGSATGGGGVSVGPAGKIAGNGTIAPDPGNSVEVAGTIAPGNSVGNLKLGTPLTPTLVTLAGRMAFELESAGNSGPINSGQSSATASHDVLTVSGFFDLLSSARVDITALNPGMNGFDPALPYSWTIATANTLNVSPEVVVGTIGGDFLGSAGTFFIGNNGTQLFLNFQPVPEPATVLAIAGAGFGLGGLIRRRFRRKLEA